MLMLPEQHAKLLKAIERGLNQMATAWDIAHRMGYRPSRKAIPAVTQMCRAINRRFPPTNPSERELESVKFADLGEYLVRLPPKDQWSSAIWCLTKAGRDALERERFERAKELSRS